jgi:hypothetical protein
VVKPSTSQRTPQRSSTRAKISTVSAAMSIGRPRIEPEWSMSRVITVLGNGESLSCLNGRARPLATRRARRDPSSTPSSRSKAHSRVWRAISTRISRFARRATTVRAALSSGFEARVEFDQLGAVGQRERVDHAVERGGVRVISAALVRRLDLGAGARLA